MANLSDLRNTLYWQRGEDYKKNYAKSIGSYHSNDEKTIIDLENRTIMAADLGIENTKPIRFKFRNDATPVDNDGNYIPVLSADGTINAENFKIGTNDYNIVLSASYQDNPETQTTNPYLIVLDQTTGKEIKICPEASENNAIIATNSDISALEHKISVDKENLTLLLEILMHSDALSNDYSSLNEILEELLENDWDR